MTAEALFSLDDTETSPEGESPKSMRELLFAGLVMQLEADAADLDPAFDESEWARDADGRARSGSAYWQAYEQARGIRLALAAARSRLETHEEYLLADADRRRREWTEAELACARHRDVCPHCTSHTQEMWQARRREDRMEAIRSIYVQGLHEVVWALADRERPLTLAEARKRLQRLTDTGHRLWAAPAVQDATTGEVLANEPGSGKTSVEVNYDTPRNLPGRDAADATSEGINPTEVPNV